MDEALAEARLSASCACAETPVSDLTEIPVGALVVAPDGRILSRAHNQPRCLHDPTAHAEVLAMRKAGEVLGNYRLGGCVLVVTLEPCLMCVGAMVHARISGVVFGAADMRTGMVQSCLQGLDLPFHNHRVWHYGGVQATACAELLHGFFMRTRAKGSPDNNGNKQRTTDKE